MKTNQTTFTPQSKETYHMGHLHFFEYLDDFHGMKDQNDYAVQHDAIMDKLRQQYLQDNNQEQNVCMRTCFKLKEKKYIDFCLDRKCGGVDILKAASMLGYAKTGHSKPRAIDSHHH